ncbi:MAG: ATP-dependent DNA helicase [Nitrososphaera sp.]
MSILEFFPLPTIRERQKEVLLGFESAIKSGFKHIFFEAPTGFGKSPVAIALALYMGNSHICTATKDLQSQYLRDFPFIFDVRGRSNFSCNVKEDMGLSETCEYGPCVRDDGYDCSFKTRLADYRVLGSGTREEAVVIDKVAENRYREDFAKKSRLVSLHWRPCEYYEQKWKGAKASHTVYNYRYFLSDFFYAGNTQKRNLLVFDEAHQLESEVGDFRSFTIHRNMLRLVKLQMPTSRTDEIEVWLEFCREYREKLDEFADKAARILERSDQRVSMEPYTEKNVIDAVERAKTLGDLLNDIRANKDNWIVSSLQKDASTGELTRVTVTPLDISSYFGSVLEKASVALFMSATILSKEYLCKTVGLAPDSVKFIRIPESDFPAINRPIYNQSVAWLNARTIGESMPNIIRAVDQIMNKHKDEKGIIHTTSYTQVEAIANGLSQTNSARLIQTGSKIERDEVLRRHFRSKTPSVLISPSLHQGVDLKDDLSRFQIIVKVPYPDLTDRKVAALKQRNPSWYMWVTILRLVQSYGRSVRSKEDFAATYILDSSFDYVRRNSGDMFPPWFTEAIVPAVRLS